MRIASLHIYPVKGMRGVALEAAQVEARGLAGDRRWLVIAEPDGRFITQRSHPGLARISARPAEGGLVLSADGAKECFVAANTAVRRTVEVWGETVDAALADDAAQEWLSDRFGEPLQLVYMDKEDARLRSTAWTPAPEPVSFADAFPILVTTTGSLVALNAEIARIGGEAVAMERFRPNIVIDCDAPWRDDYWKRLRIGALEIDLVKPCDRCLVTTRDQRTGESLGKEPLKSLARLRRSADPRVDGVLFGWNAVPRGSATVAVGDPVEVVEQRPEGFPLSTPAIADA